MPALTNQRQERFCQLLKQGIPRYRAYPLAGYSPDRRAPYRLSETSRIKARVAELTRHIAVKTRVTVESISDDLDRITAGAEASEQWAAAKGAVETKAKLHGLLIDRKEAGAPGDFAGLQSAAEVIAVVEKEFGAEATAALMAVLNKQPVQPALEATHEADSGLN